jgi:hypothetical protein
MAEADIASVYAYAGKILPVANALSRIVSQQRIARCLLAPACA